MKEKKEGRVRGKEVGKFGQDSRVNLAHLVHTERNIYIFTYARMYCIMCVAHMLQTGTESG